MIKVYIECPYCRLRQRTPIEYCNRKAVTVVTCDLEEGGCDKDFVLEYNFEVKTKVRAIMDEWE